MILLTILVLSALAAAPAQQPKAGPRECGYDRWPVKILADKDRDRVNFRPVDSTVAELGAIPIHEVPYPRDRRIAPEELQVYRVRAKLLKVTRQQDSDLHLLLADLDDSGARMIAEIPAPECAVGTGHEGEYRAARDALRKIPGNSTIEVVGVAFFDFVHDQRGAAKNGIEIHPVLAVSLMK